MIEATSFASGDDIPFRAKVALTLNAEAVRSLMNVVRAAGTALESIAALVHKDGVTYSALTRCRYDFEHKMLLEWHKQLTSSSEGSLHFLNQYYFGVSDDPLLDKIDWVNSPECRVDVGDMKLPLYAIRHLAESLMASLEAVLAETANSSANVSLDGVIAPDDTTSTVPASITHTVSDEGVAGKPEGVLDAFVTASMAAGRSLVVNFSGMPKAWKSSKRIESLVRGVVKAPSSVKSAENAFASMTVDLILSLVYATLRRSPSLDYCKCLYEAVANEEGDTFDLQSALSKICAHPRLREGWWPSSSSIPLRAHQRRHKMLRLML